MSKPLVKHRCKNCNKVMVEAEAGAMVRIKCGCGTWNIIEHTATEKRPFVERMDGITKKQLSA